MSRIDIQLFGSRAEVVTVPSLLLRVLFRERERHAMAVRIAGEWCWDFTAKPVDDLTAKAINDATRGTS